MTTHISKGCHLFSFGTPGTRRTQQDTTIAISEVRQSVYQPL